MLNHYLDKIFKRFALDLRFLALARVFLGIIIGFEYFHEISEIPVWLGSTGLLPLQALNSAHPILSYFNLFNYFSGDWFLAVFFTFFGISLIAFILGYRTKTATFFVSFCLYQLFLRNPFINSGGDEILRLQVLVMLFLNTSAYFSLDSALKLNRPPEQDKEVHNSIWHFIYTFQLLAIYFFSAAMKSDPQWWKDFTAVEYALSLDLFSSTFGNYLLGFPGLLRFFSALTFYGEWLLPFFFMVVKFLPFTRIRSYVTDFIVLFFLGLHLSILATMNIGHFPYICLLLWLPLFSERVFDTLFKITKEDQIRIIYDGNCLFCRKGVYVLCRFLLLDPAIFVSSQMNDPHLKAVMSEKNSWIVIINNQKYFQFHAFSQLIKYHPILIFRLFYPIVIALLPLGNVIYKMIANNRNTVGRLFSWLKFSNFEKSSNNSFVGLLGVGTIFIILYINFLQLNPHEIDKMTPNQYYSVFGLSQNWNMFAPKPRSRDEWILILSQKDLGQPRNYQKDKLQFFSNIKNKKWKKYYFSLFDNKYLHPDFIKHYCLLHNLQGEHFLVYFYQQNFLNQQESRVQWNIKSRYRCEE